MKRRSVISTIIGSLIAAPLLVLTSAPSSATDRILLPNPEDWPHSNIIKPANTQIGAQAYLAEWHVSNQSALSSNLIYNFPAELIEIFQRSHPQTENPASN